MIASTRVHAKYTYLLVNKWLADFKSKPRSQRNERWDRKTIKATRRIHEVCWWIFEYDNCCAETSTYMCAFESILKKENNHSNRNLILCDVVRLLELEPTQFQSFCTSYPPHERAHAKSRIFMTLIHTLSGDICAKTTNAKPVCFDFLLIHCIIFCYFFWQA